MHDVDVGPSWLALLVAGIINSLYGAIYFLWTLIPLVIGGLVAFQSIKRALDGGGDPMGMVFTLFTILTPFIQVIAYAVIVFMGLITIFAAFRLRATSSKGIVMLGILAAFGAPVLGFIFTSLSLCNFGSSGCCLFGFLAGNIGTIPAFVASMIGGGWALAIIRDSTVSAAFDE